MKPRILAIVSAALFVAACGSSKKSSPAHVAAHDVSYTDRTTPVAIATVGDAVGTVNSAMAGLDSVSGNMGQFTSVTGVSGTAQVTIQDAVRLAARWFPKVGEAQASGAAISAGGNCQISGSGSVTGNVLDTNNAGANTGDWAQFTFNNCQDTAGVFIDGVMRIDIVEGHGSRSMDLAPSVMPLGTYRATITFTDLSFAQANGTWSGMDGNITLAITKRASPNEIESSISGTGLVFGVGQGTSLLEGTMLTAPTGQTGYLQDTVEVYGSGFTSPYTSTRETLNSKVCSTAMHGCVQVVTNSPILDNAGAAHPYAGSFTISAGNAMIRIDILSVTNVNVTYDLNTTDATPATGPINQTWTCLDANTCTWP